MFFIIINSLSIVYDGNIKFIGMKISAEKGVFRIIGGVRYKA